MTAPDNHFDLIVIGSGAAGSSCWFTARQAGKSVAVFEDGILGGECANVACVPTKALLHAAEVLDTVRSAPRFGIDPGDVSFDYRRVKAWKDSVVAQTGAAQGEAPFAEAGVTLIRRRARFVGPNAIEAGGQRYTAERFLIATGARQSVPSIEGLAETGYIAFYDAIDLTAPPASLFVLGGGAVGCEFTQLFSSFGSKVIIANTRPRLVAKEDPEVGDFLGESFRERGIEVLTGATTTKVERAGGKKRVTLKRNGRAQTVEVDEVLVATGKTPNTDLGLEAARVEYDKAGVKVNAGMQTANPAVFAAGDVAGPFRFTHTASYQGQVAFHNMWSDRQVEVDYRAVPRCVFTTPEIAAVGLTELQAREQHDTVRTGFADLVENDRGLTTDQRRGFVKVIADGEGTLLGGVMVGPRAGEVIHELGLAVSLGANASAIASLIHAFPTFSEALGQACSAIVM